MKTVFIHLLHVTTVSMVLSSCSLYYDEQADRNTIANKQSQLSSLQEREATLIGEQQISQSKVDELEDYRWDVRSQREGLQRQTREAGLSNTESQRQNNELEARRNAQNQLKTTF